MQHGVRLRLIALPVVFYLLATVCVFGLIRHKTDGHFTYSLDDPYIHMAVAEQIAQGHYGINAGEASSPSSSVLWPFLLVPFAGRDFHTYVPLVWNFLAGLVAAGLIGLAIAEWPERRDDRCAEWMRPVSALALVLAGNVIGVTFLGMEHGLQVMLAVGCGFGVCRALSGRAVPRWCVVAAAVAPMIRYEDLTLTLAVGVALMGARRWRLAATMGVVAVAPLVGFSIFLHRLGLPLLPLSVLVKGNASGANTTAGVTVVRLVGLGVLHALTEPQRWPMVVLFAILGAAAWRTQERVRRFALAGAAAAIALQLLFGRFGWLHRYEVYALVFAAMIAMRLLAEQRAPHPGWYAMALLALTTPYLKAVGETLLSADDVYGQQYQMHRFATEFYRGNVAVGDLGLVSYKLGAGRYVLDLGGLASVETARVAVKSAAWLESVVRRKDVGLVMIYPKVLPIPADWAKLGTICLVKPPVEIGGQCVDFFATNVGEVPELKKEFGEFAKTLPRETVATVEP